MTWFLLFPLWIAGFAVPLKEPRNSSIVSTDSLIQIDGPFILYRDDKIFSRYILENGYEKTVQTDSFSLAQKNELSFRVSTDMPGKTFTVKLKSKLENEKSIYKKVSRMFVISDMEGNFAAFRKILMANGVIDADFNWTFGDGHLVTVGDFFDRGYQVTELLWLIYSLEEKANAAGGHVHFILGNHEIMNMSNDLRYLHAKYLQTTTLLQEPYYTLYSASSELGRWLRTKNVMEKIGDVLFMHAGFSPEMNRMDVSIKEINDLARPFYADTNYVYPDLRVDTIYSDLGPFWYRGYYKNDNRNKQQQVDSTLEKFGVKTIVHGHTIVADTISSWFKNRVINIDVHHAAGKSEALLIEDKKFYRLNAAGEKKLIFER
jgi:hypothetical protein